MLSMPLTSWSVSCVEHVCTCDGIVSHMGDIRVVEKVFMVCVDAVGI